MARRTGRRAGFTLVELLIVISIIAVLAALTIAAVSRAKGVGQRTTAVSEINQLDAAAASFKLKFGFFPPSHVVWNDPSTTPPTPRVVRFRVPTMAKEADASFPSYLLLRRMFPRWQPRDANGMGSPLPKIPGALNGVAYTILAADLPHAAGPNGSTLTQGGAAQELDPNQAMVYFLGGPWQQGWTTDQPQDPMGSSARITQFYEFPAGRLVQPKSIMATSPSTMAFQYVDPWATPYAYFSSGPGGDVYNPLVQFPWNTNSASGAAPDSYNPGAYSLTGTADPNAPATFTAHPYMGMNGKWLNPGKVQIVSAGADQMFGPGSPKTATGATAPSPLPADAPSPFNSPWVLPWVPEKGYYVSGSDKTGLNRGDDDLGNFNSGIILGTQAQ